MESTNTLKNAHAAKRDVSSVPSSCIEMGTTDGCKKSHIQCIVATMPNLHWSTTIRSFPLPWYSSESNCLLKYSKAGARSTSTDDLRCKTGTIGTFKPLPRSASHANEVYVTRHCDSGTNPQSCAKPHDTSISTAFKRSSLSSKFANIHHFSHLWFFFFRAPKGALLRRRNKSYAVIFFFGRSSTSGSILPAKHSGCLTLSS